MTSLYLVRQRKSTKRYVGLYLCTDEEGPGMTVLIQRQNIDHRARRLPKDRIHADAVKLRRELSCALIQYPEEVPQSVKDCAENSGFQALPGSYW